MDVINTHIQRVILANREAKITPQPVTLLVIAPGICIGGIVAVVENFPAQADAINGKIGIGGAQFNIGLVAVTRAVKTHAVAGA